MPDTMSMRNGSPTNATGLAWSTKDEIGNSLLRSVGPGAIEVLKNFLPETNENKPYHDLLGPTATLLSTLYPRHTDISPERVLIAVISGSTALLAGKMIDESKLEEISKIIIKSATCGGFAALGSYGAASHDQLMMATNQVTQASATSTKDSALPAGAQKPTTEQVAIAIGAVIVAQEEANKKLNLNCPPLTQTQINTITNTCSYMTLPLSQADTTTIISLVNGYCS